MLSIWREARVNKSWRLNIQIEVKLLELGTSQPFSADDELEIEES